jgi:hypothetical protein
MVENEGTKVLDASRMFEALKRFRANSSNINSWAASVNAIRGRVQVVVDLTLGRDNISYDGLTLRKIHRLLNLSKDKGTVAIDGKPFISDGAECLGYSGPLKDLRFADHFIVLNKGKEQSSVGIVDEVPPSAVIGVVEHVGSKKRTHLLVN